MLYGRVLRKRRGLRRGYDAVHNAWRDNSSKDEKSKAVFLLFDYYSNMMAVLTSRGFDGLGSDGVDALVPLFNLLNHVRGGKAETAAAGGVRDTTCGQSAQLTPNDRMCDWNEEQAPKDMICDGTCTPPTTGEPDVRYARYDGANR